MKKIFTILFLVAFFQSNLFAQAPQKMSYQAIVRNASNALLSNATVGMRISVLQGSSSGTAVYAETHTLTTNVNALATMEIGTGTPVSGTFASIDWQNGPFFIKTEIDPAGGSSYSVMGTAELLSVPYALQAAKANIPDGVNPGDILYWDGAAWVILPIGGEDDILKVNSSGIPNWSPPITTAISPTVTTDSITNIYANGALVYGNAVSSGGELVISKGICYGTSTAPTVAGNFVSYSTGGLGTYAAGINGLMPNTIYYTRAYATSIAGTSYGTQLTFTTTNGIITLTSTAASAITSCTAMVGGTIVNVGGAPPSNTGIVYSTSPAPTLANSVLNLYSGAFSFSPTINGLVSNTTYYYKAFATNSIGTFYGNELSFTTTTAPITLTTAAPTAIGGCGASVAYTATSSNPLSTSGLVYSLSPSPTLADSVKFYNPGYPFYNNINGSTQVLDGLAASTAYYVKSFAISCGGDTTYGPQVNFTTLNGVISLTTGIFQVFYVCAIGGYSGTTISVNNGAPIAAQGVCYSASSNPTIANNLIGAYIGGGYYGAANLLPNTTYYFRAYATNCNGTTYYGNEVNYTTNVGISSVTTSAAVSITAGTALLSGTVIGNSSYYEYYNYGYCYSTSPTPTIADSVRVINVYSTGSQSYPYTLKGLTANTTYYYRTYAEGNGNCIPLSYGSVQSFTTAASPFAIGQAYGGGIIVYVNGLGTGGIIAALTDQGFAEYGCQGTTAGSTASTTGSGQANTTAIIGACGTASIAADICNNLLLNSYSDWYLPSEAELILIGALNYFPSGNYWSSTEIDANQARYVNNITASNSNKNFSGFKVRAVRSF
jgi:hypothetical protein